MPFVIILIFNFKQNSIDEQILIEKKLINNNGYIISNKKLVLIVFCTCIYKILLMYNKKNLA